MNQLKIAAIEAHASGLTAFSYEICDCEECELMPANVRPVIFIEGMKKDYGWTSIFTKAYIDHIANDKENSNAIQSDRPDSDSGRGKLRSGHRRYPKQRTLSKDR